MMKNYYKSVVMIYVSLDHFGNHYIISALGTTRIAREAGKIICG